MNTLRITSEEYYALISKCNNMKIELAELKERNAFLEKTAWERSVEFERIKKLADQSVKELDKIMKMVSG